MTKEYNAVKDTKKESKNGDYVNKVEGSRKEEDDKVKR